MRKDKKWLKDEVSELYPSYDEMYVSPDYETVAKTETISKVLELINQLDDPETLSQEWIDENVVEGDFRGEQEFWYGRFIEEEKVRNLLVPKKDDGFVVFEKDKVDEEVQRMIDETYKAMNEKPVIPKFVADWYEENLSGGYTNNRNKFSGNDVFRVIQDVLNISEGFNTWEDYNLDEKIVAWVEENEEDFIHLIVNCSYKDGYEVEKEKLYHVVNKENYFMLRKYDGLVDILHASTSMSRDEFGKDTRFMLTEQEIKDYDERFLVFAEEVTE
ncbi:DUF1642 domain-containing protein [Jeotgalibaca porci]|uniref:DUF1642 domain-containing protein n=1 Tax=Jeotgalibaca porci TaxID=1868793 RepID=UPI0035A0B6E5